MRYFSRWSFFKPICNKFKQTFAFRFQIDALCWYISFQLRPLIPDSQYNRSVYEICANSTEVLCLQVRIGWGCVTGQDWKLLWVGDVFAAVWWVPVTGFFLSRGGRGGRLLSLFGPSGTTLPAGVKRCCQVVQQLVALAPLSPEAPYGHADNTSAFHWGFTDIHPATSFPLYKFYCHLSYIQRIWLLCRFVRFELC